MENLDLTQILKDCPKGTKLFCTEYGYVKLYEICKDDEFPILVVANSGKSEYFTKDGYYQLIQNRDEYAEPSLYPAHNQRDWSKFKVPTSKVKVTLHPFDKVLGKMGNTSVWHADFFDQKVGNHIDFSSKIDWDEVVPYNKDTAYLVGTDEKCPIDYEIEFSKEFKED